jgi:hypothetical protein
MSLVRPARSLLAVVSPSLDGRMLTRVERGLRPSLARQHGVLGGAEEHALLLLGQVLPPGNAARLRVRVVIIQQQPRIHQLRRIPPSRSRPRDPRCLYCRSGDRECQGLPAPGLPPWQSGTAARRCPPARIVRRQGASSTRITFAVLDEASYARNARRKEEPDSAAFAYWPSIQPSGTIAPAIPSGPVRPRHAAGPPPP